jgi:hypothetical protein
MHAIDHAFVFCAMSLDMSRSSILQPAELKTFDNVH